MAVRIQSYETHFIAYFVYKDEGNLAVCVCVCCRNVKSKSKKDKKGVDSDSDSEGDLDDEEVSLGSLEDEEFGEELEEEGGEFMDMEGDDDDEGVCARACMGVYACVYKSVGF